MIVAIYIIGFVIASIHFIGVNAQDSGPKPPAVMCLLVACFWFVVYPLLAYEAISDRIGKREQ